MGLIMNVNGKHVEATEEEHHLIWAILHAKACDVESGYPYEGMTVGARFNQVEPLLKQMPDTGAFRKVADLFK